MIFEHSNYRTFLRVALAEKAKDSQGYSLRAFSEKIQVSNSYLSEVLSQKKSLSVDLAFKIAVKLDLTDTEAQYFCLLVQLEHEKDPSFREELSRRISQLNPSRRAHDLSADVFKAISEWYHLALLELTYLPGFRLEPRAIAEKLGISVVEAEMAMERLERLELLEKDSRNRYRKAQSYVLSESKIPQGAFRQYHRQLLQKAVLSLENQTPKERVSASDVVAFDAKQLPAVDRLSREFSDAVIKISERSKVKNSVYALSTHFFRVTDVERKKS